jgi:hypothetical protein
MDQPTPVEPSAARPASQSTWNDSFSQLDSYAEQLRVKLPLAPPGLMNFYMNVWPWVAIVFGALGILISLFAVVGSTVLGPLMIMFGEPGTGLSLLLGSLLSLAGSALALIGGWMMLQRKTTGWWLLAFGYVINFLSSLVHISVLALIVILAFAYVHLEVKPNYK